MQKKFFIFYFIILTHTITVIPKTKTKKLDAVKNTQQIFTPQLPKVAPAKRILSVTNNIKPEMLTYKHWIAGTLEPKVKILIDGKELEPGKTATIAIENGTLPVEFSYSFMDGYRKGHNEVTFEVPEKQDKLAMTFSWENDYRIILDNAKPIKKKPIKDQVS